MSASGEYLDSVLLDRAVDALLSRNGIVALALTDAAVRVPLPDDLARVTSLPTDRETVVDFVTPADRMTVVNTWERAQVIGLAQGHVRLSGNPDQPVTFTVVDTKHRYGVWLGFLNSDQWEPAADTPPLDLSLLVPTRPRTATVHKNLYAMITYIDERL